MAENNNNTRPLDTYHLTVMLHGKPLPLGKAEFGFNGARFESTRPIPLGAIISIELCYRGQAQRSLARVITGTLSGFDARFIEPDEPFIALVMELITPHFAAANTESHCTGEVITVDFRNKKILDASAA